MYREKRDNQRRLWPLVVIAVAFCSLCARAALAQSCSSDAECDDNNACTADSCLNGGCLNISIDPCGDCSIDFHCNDSNACTTDSCVDHSCVNTPISGCVVTCSSDPDCLDNDPCTRDTCREAGSANSSCQHVSDCTLCASVCDDNNPCTVDTCSQILHSCSNQSGSGGAVCRAANGQCDVAETCSFFSSVCPPDGFAATTVACTGSSQDGLCDDNEADHCLGTDKTTCVDAFKSSSTTCRAATGQCDVAETCSGTSSACPADGFAATTVACTGSSQDGLCDDNEADHCLGTDKTTCVDAFKSSSTTCRAAAGQCDVAETCSGTSAACPADGKQPNGTACPADADSDLCTQDLCDGSTNACTHPPFQPTTGCTVNGQRNKPCLGTSPLINVIIGTPGKDVIIGSSGFDTITGAGGDDLICGRAGNDVLFGGVGNDQLAGEGGGDILWGEGGNDTLDGGPGSDTLNGGAGNDQCVPGDFLTFLCNP